MSTVAHRRFTRLGVAAGCCAAALATEAALAPAALALSSGGIVPAGFLGLPSLHGIIEAVAGGFFSALAKALVPSWLTHGTVATIQHLVALPDPAEWPHVRALEAETTYLGAMLAPLTLTVAVLRYWMLGLTGAAHPASAVARCAGATGVLVAYTWIVEQVVAGTNTLTHGLLALGSVSGGLARIIGVLFGGALLTGTGGVFGALLVILGVIFAAGLFATQLLLTVVLAVLIVAGPPLIALAAVPELAHLARAWRDALMTVALIPLGWTVLFATAGALCLDATSFTGGGGGLPGHIAAAFAGLITFALAVKLPLVLLDELRHVLSRASLTGASSSAAATSTLPGTERVRSAHARLRAIGLAGAPAIGASIGAAAGALGAPAGGPLGAARRRLSNAGNRPGGRASADSATPGRAVRRGIGERIVQARAILARAPQQAARAVREATPQTPTGRSRFERTRRAPGAQQNRERPGGGPSGAAGERPQAQQGTAPRRAASSSRPKSRVTLAAVPSSPRAGASASPKSPPASTPPRRPLMHTVSTGEQEGMGSAPGARERPAAPPSGRSGGPDVTQSSRQRPPTRPAATAPTAPKRAPRGARRPRARKGKRP